MTVLFSPLFVFARNIATTLIQLLRQNGFTLAALFGGVLIPLVLFGKLAQAMRQNHVLEWDEMALRLIHQHSLPWLDTFFVLLTQMGYWLTLPFLLCVIAALRVFKQPLEAAFFAITISGAWLLNLSAKLFFQRDRPQLWQSLVSESNYSFPSGHAMISTALSLALLVVLWPTRLRIIGCIGVLPAIFVIGLSRLYLGVHYPTDILAGWCAGLVWATGVYGICIRRRTGVNHDHAISHR